MRRYFVHRLIARAVLLIVVARSGIAAEPAAKRPTEVVVIATQHFITDMPAGYTPGHLRALLQKVRPDVVAVEACMNMDDPWMTAPYELAKVTRPWAIEEKVKVLPVGWSEPNYGVEIGAMFNRFALAGKAAEYQEVEATFQKKSAEQTMTAARMNDENTLKLWRDYHAVLHELNGGDTPWEEWNAKIVGNVAAVCREHVGKRVAVVFGGAHAYYFVDRLAAEPGVRVIAAENFFPLRDEEVQAATQDVDYLAAMRLLNFGGGSLAPKQLAELEKQLAKLETIKQYQNDAQYFRARMHIHRRQGAEALKKLETLVAVKPGVVLAFDGVTPVRDAARLQTYFALADMGKKEAAIEKLQEIAADETATLPMRQTAEGLLQADGASAAEKP